MPRARFNITLPLSLVATAILLSGCNVPQLPGAQGFTQVYTRGYVVQDGALEQVVPGSSRDQVAFVLGTPTVTATFDNEVYYYITQQVERVPGFEPAVIDQRVIAVYFDKAQKVTHVATYAKQDGKVINIATRTTPTGGREQTFLGQLFNNLLAR